MLTLERLAAHTRDDHCNLHVKVVEVAAALATVCHVRLSVLLSGVEEEG